MIWKITKSSLTSFESLREKTAELEFKVNRNEKMKKRESKGSFLSPNSSCYQS